jgi:hypothetical protein
MKLKNSAGIVTHSIYRVIDRLYKLFLLCQEMWQNLQNLENDLANMDASNPDYAEIRSDSREKMKILWNLVLIALSLGIDYVLIYQPLEILSSIYGLPIYIKYAVPAILIILELGIAYRQILNQRDGEPGAWAMRNVQFLVIVILVGLSILLIVFTLQGYDPAFDGSSFLGFFTGTVLFQLCLLFSSILLHLFLIKNAEILSETFGYFRYIFSRASLMYRINGLNKKYAKKAALYKEDCRQLIHKISAFKSEYPESKVQFETAMPEEFINSINTVMGRTVLDYEAMP